MQSGPVYDGFASEGEHRRTARAERKADDAREAVLPAAMYLIVASRLIPDLDAGFTVSVMRRARDISEYTASGGTGEPASGGGVAVALPLLLTVDIGARADHDAHRAEWMRRGMLRHPSQLRNLFDDARADGSWLRAAATPLEESPAVPADVDYRVITNDAGRAVLEIPFGVGGANWHLTDAPIKVWAPDGTAPVGTLAGYAGLYRAWISWVAHTQAQEHELPVVVVCEARQIGELLVEGPGLAAETGAATGAPLAPLDVPIVHTTHACHVRAPFTWDAPMDPAWARWLRTADRYDAVLWLTETQLRDVERRVVADGGEAQRGIRSYVVPHPAPRLSVGEPVPGRIVMLNSLIRRKRVDHALRGLARARAQVPHAHLDVYGDGAERASLQDYAAQLGVADAVTWHGHVSDSSVAWQGADLFLFTSENEGQGLVLLEALAHGVPVVAYDAAYGPADTLDDGGGILVPTGDVEALGGAIAKVLGRRELRDELSAQAQRAALSHGVEASMRAFADAVTDVLA